MMVAAATLPDRRTSHPAVVLAAASGCLALALRPAGVVAAVAITASVGAIGLVACIPVDAGARRPSATRRWLAALAVGLAAIAAGQAFSHMGATPWWAPAVLASVLAAVAEEAFFRRFVYGVLTRRGVGTAVAGAALLFALVHVPAYGVATVPINLAAGLLLGWQRWVTGGWSASALTHLAANALHYTT